MRVIAGKARRLPLKTPAGMDTRPTTDRIKETLFNMLQNEVPGCVFVDMFSGSGSIGIEALSRGAKKAYFVENDRTALECIDANLKFTRLTNCAIVLKQDAVFSVHNIFESHVDIIYMDPPYNCDLEKQVLRMLPDMHYVSEDTLIIIEASMDTDFSYLDSMGYVLEKEKRYKTNKHMFIRKKPQSENT